MAPVVIVFLQRGTPTRRTDAEVGCVMSVMISGVLSTSLTTPLHLEVEVAIYLTTKRLFSFHLYLVLSHRKAATSDDRLQNPSPLLLKSPRSIPKLPITRVV